MFLLSIILVVLSSYFISISTITRPKKDEKNSTYQRINSSTFIYFLLIAFSQIVLSFEILSLFSVISKNNFFICNLVFLICSAVLCLVKNAEFNLPEFNYKHILSVIKKDKFLMFLSICFILFCFLQLIKIFIFPVTFGDALSYYFSRCTSWLQNGNILHYITPDTRELIMPINMDFLYMWVLMFTKSEHGLGIFSYISFILGCYVIYNLLRELKFSVKRSLWSVFVFSSFALIVVEMTEPSGNLFLGVLILSSIYLFIKSVKYNDKINLFFSSLALALAVGIKTTAIIAIPSVFFIMCAISYIYAKTLSTFTKPLILFSAFFIFNYIIFSSYNYILNYIQFSNPISSPDHMLICQFQGGLSGYISNVIKYLFAFLDMSGMPEFININDKIENIQNWLLGLISDKGLAGTSGYFFSGSFKFSNKMGLMETFLGVMGLFVFIPSIIYAIKRAMKKPTNKILAILALSFILNILILSGSMIFISYNLRFLLTFSIIAMPVVVYSYPKNMFCKLFLGLIMFMYLIGFNYNTSIKYVFDCIKQFKIIQIDYHNEEKDVFNYFIKMEPKNIGMMSAQINQSNFFIERLKLYGFHIDKILAENVEDYDLTKYDYLITDKVDTPSSLILKFEERMKYPNRFISRCMYLDKDLNILQFYDENITPTLVNCYIPFDYFFHAGFITDTDYNSDKYTILKRGL